MAGEIGTVVIAAFDIGPLLGWWHRLRLMIDPLQLACPVMSRSTGFLANETAQKRRAEFECVKLARILPHNDLSFGIDAVHLGDDLHEFAATKSWPPLISNIRRPLAKSGPSTH